MVGTREQNQGDASVLCATLEPAILEKFKDAADAVLRVLRDKLTASEVPGFCAAAADFNKLANLVWQQLRWFREQRERKTFTE